MHFSYCSDTPGLIVARNHINGAVLHHFRALKLKANDLYLLTDLPYPEGKIHINKRKIDNVRKLLNYIPRDDEIQDF